MTQQEKTSCECGFPGPCPFIEGCEKVQRDDDALVAEAASADPCADLYKALVEAKAKLARMRRAISVMLAPIPSTKGMDPKAKVQRLHAEWERRVREVKELAGVH